MCVCVRVCVYVRERERAEKITQETQAKDFCRNDKYLVQTFSTLKGRTQKIVVEFLLKSPSLLRITNNSDNNYTLSIFYSTGQLVYNVLRISLAMAWTEG